MPIPSYGTTSGSHHANRRYGPALRLAQDWAHPELYAHDLKAGSLPNKRRRTNWLSRCTAPGLAQVNGAPSMQQVIRNLAGRSASGQRFTTPMLYELVRTQSTLPSSSDLWAPLVMSAAFALVTTAYIFVDIAQKRRRSHRAFGDEYRHYRQRVAM